MPTTLTLRQPDDWHVHFREGAALSTTVPHTARCFARAAVMPNLKDPVCSPAQALAYRQAIQAHIPKGNPFQPMMSLYLTEDSDPAWVSDVQQDPALLAFKYYPAHATTHAAHGVRDITQVYPVLEAMQAHNVPLQIHGEVTDPTVDIFDREARFIETVLEPTLTRFPNLRVILEHITTRDAVQFVLSHSNTATCRLAATITPHHLLLNRNDLFVGGMQPHHYCLPVLKRNVHQEALIQVATSGHPSFFLGTDSAPHAKHAKESACGCAGVYSAHAAIELYAMVFESVDRLSELEAFASLNGAGFYQLPPNERTMTLAQQAWEVPNAYPYGEAELIPLWSGQHVRWSLLP